MSAAGAERRRYVRVKASVRVRYKFYHCFEETQSSEVSEGLTENISSGGIFLRGKIPKAEWVPELLQRKMVMALKIFLPTEQEPVKALARLAWIEGTKEEERENWAMGLEFQEMSAEDRDKLTLFVIKTQLP